MTAADLRIPAGLRASPAPSRDRLMTTLFVAALVHGLLIVGITFDAGRRASGAPGLEVLLVSDEVPKADSNDGAAYLAQRTQKGSGNTDKAVAPRNRAGGVPLEATDGAPDGMPGSTADEHRDGNEAEDEPVLTTSAQSMSVRYVGVIGSESPATRPLLIPTAAEATGPGEETGPTQVRGPKRDELYITPDTREASLAPYMDGWRRKVERIGTLNFPSAARRRTARASPVVEVSIDASGKLLSATIARTSGFDDLDQAAISILKLASPFDPFPSELSNEYRVLRFAYEWQFVGGRLEAGSLSTIP